MAQWYIMYNNQQVGPMDISQLRAYGLQPGTQVWTEGMPCLLYTSDAADD